MPKFGRKSKKNLSTCAGDLQMVFNEVIRHVDCTVTCGHRGKEDQNKAVEEGRSKVKFPKGRHNSSPSRAVDVYRWPVDFKDLERQTLFAGFVLGIANQMGIELIWGNDWDGDFETKDTGFNDYPHFELKKEF